MDIHADSGSGDDKHREEVLQTYCREHLERMGLIAIEQRFTDRALQLLYSRNRAEITPKGYSITRLGLTLLKQLDLVKSISQRQLNTLDK